MGSALDTFCVVAMLSGGLLGCGRIVGIDEYSVGTPRGDAEPGTGGAAGSGGTGGAAATGGTVVGPSCADASVTDADGVDGAVGSVCGFLMPNPASAPGELPNRASYKRQGANTVTDLVTGLTWEANVDQTVYRQDEAVDYCKNKGSGWRLPSRLELVTLVDFTIARPGPTIATAQFGSETVWNAVPDPELDYRKFWTLSHAAFTTSMGWEVDFLDGSTHQRPSTKFFKVRCVLGTPCRCATTRFQIQGAQQDEVFDAITGLTWQQGYAGTMVWSDATGFCPTGWRLPTPGELATLVDETKEQPSIYWPPFPMDTPGEPFWTSFPQAGTADGSVPTSAWYVTFYHGHSDVYPSSDPYWVKCVR